MLPRSGSARIPPRSCWQSKLIGLMPAPMSKVFFNNSGSEANDTAIKLVWYYNNAIGRPRKKKIIARMKGYHGSTIGSASLAGLPFMHMDFDLPIAGIRHTDCPAFYRGGKPGETEEDFAARMAENLDALIEREGPDTVAAFIAEPVQGSGGVVVPPRGYFAKIQEVLRKHDVLFIADEVICGFGRTGNMFGCETFAITPDIMTVAKSLVVGLSADLGNDHQREAVPGAGVEQRETRQLHPWLHLFRPSGLCRGGPRNAEDLPGARHHRPCADGGAALPGRAATSCWTIRWSATCAASG